MILEVNINEIKPNPQNPRVIKDDKFKKLVQSIKEFPEMLNIRPIVVNKDMIVLGGNMRLKACREAGLKEIPIIYAENLDEDKQREFIIKDNVGFGEWDWNNLKEWDQDELIEWGLDIPDFKEEHLEATDDGYEIPDEIKTDIVLGDLFEIGEHRLLCGDSTNVLDVEKLMNGEKADMVFTDPPYGMNYQLGTTKNKIDKIIGDKESFNISEIWSIIYNIPTIYICTRFDIYVEWQNKIDRKVNNIIVWVKSNMGAGDLKNYGYQHEFIMYWGDKIDNKRDTNIWQEGNTPKNEYQGHPTQKPISLICRAINNHNAKNIFDLFLGSGSTMVASHQLKRKCYGMELDPKYCQVIIDRMRKLDPSIEIKRNGILLETVEKQS
jgi:DNA modification methylase